ncbi:MAG: NYN domain-containing protein [Firmicutes bacterium]|nr:NYN domain-containing protein [Bacillota bacterium]
MADFLLVDGYNILHAWAGLKKVMKKDIDHARAKLVEVLGNYQAVRGVQVIVVFDAHLVKGGTGSKENVTGVEVVYTAEGETADMLIEKLVGRLTEKGRVTVATSDWIQQRIVFGKGAVRLSARELENEVAALKCDIQEQIENVIDNDRKLHGYLDDNIREILEKIRRQK